jgi:hypothetical protein
MSQLEYCIVASAYNAADTIGPCLPGRDSIEQMVKPLPVAPAILSLRHCRIPGLSQYRSTA